MPEGPTEEVPVEQGDDDPSPEDQRSGENDDETLERIEQTVGTEEDAPIREQAAETARQVMSLSTGTQGIADVIVEMDVMSRTPAGPLPRSQEAFDRGAGAGSSLEQSREAGREALKEESKKPTLLRRVKFWDFALPAFFTAASTLLSALSFYLMVKKQANEVNGKTDSSDEELTPEQKEMIRNQLKLWWKEDDKKFWARVQHYCDKWNPSVQQMVFEMNAIAGMSEPVSPPWTWASGDLKYKLIMQLAEDFVTVAKPKVPATAATVESPSDPPVAPAANDADSTTAWDQFFATLTGYTYDGYGTGTKSPLPRKIAADVAHLAFSQIYWQWKQQLKPPAGGA
ncbi:hypothetical protein ACFVFQ_28680 [Streptomyces sp. NPDC057743]|uniref:hypothetical protein n=1 Tax=Streptomyces sp. NPDC057743 TaxID=3346236 RepID=UPI003698F656